MRYRSFLTVVAVLGILAAHSSPARASDSTVAFGFWYVISSAESNDPSYTAPFGSLNISGRLGSVIMFNGSPNYNAKFATLKFYQASAPSDPSVSSCVRKALAVASTQLLIGPTPTGPNAGLNIKLIGDVRLNEGNGGYDGQPNLTVIEVRSLKSIVCEASFFYPSWP